MSAQSQRIEILDYLRGLAAFAVCFFHLSNGNSSLLPAESIVKILGSYGWLGVEAFFVISGFVIPYSLYRKHYQIGDYGTFVFKRILRLDPPYILCIVLVVFLNYLSSIAPGYQGQAFSIEVPFLLGHLAYLNSFLGYGWLLPVFWTLAIEFQYYLGMGLLYPIIAHPRRRIRSIVLIVLLFGSAGLAQSGLLHPGLITKYIPIFLVGVVCFYQHVKLVSVRHFWVLLIVVSGVVGWTVGLQACVVSALTGLTICFGSKVSIPRWLCRPLGFLGMISYSLYLVHVPIGGRVVNLGVRFVDSYVERISLCLLALIVSIVASWVFYHIIEKPSMRWCFGIRYGSARRKVPSSAATAS